MNLAILLGSVVTDPTLEHTNGGRGVCRFRLVTSSGKNFPSTSHSIVILGKDPQDDHPENVSKILTRGSKVLVSGRIAESRWSSKTTGREHFRTEIIASGIEFVSLARSSDKVNVEEREGGDDNAIS